MHQRLAKWTVQQMPRHDVQQVIMCSVASMSQISVIEQCGELDIMMCKYAVQPQMHSNSFH